MARIRLSILTATHDRRELLRRTLDSLKEQIQLPQDFEVVVVVDGSQDGTLEMLAEYRAEAPYRLVFEYQRPSGKPAAINRAATIASAPYCLVLDDDMVAAPELVREHLQLQERSGGAVGVGPMGLEIRSKADGMTQWFKRGWDERYERIRRAPEHLTYKRCFGGNLSFPRSDFLEVGGWLDLDRGGDVELGYRLERSGLRVLCAPEAWATQYFPGGFRHIVWNAERSGSGGVATYERHPPTLPITVGHFREATSRSLLLRELLLLTRPSARLLARADPIIRRLPEAHAIYGAIHSYFLWRGVRAALGADDRWRALRRGTVILSYEAPPGRMRLLLQMGWLKLRRYNVISLDEYVRERSEFRIPRRRSAVLTFDGTRRELTDVASSILSRLGLPATIFVDSEAAEAPEVDGIGLGLMVHARSAERLASLSPDRALERIAGSRARLESRFGRRIVHLAYRPRPADGRFEELAEQAGFHSACGAGVGANGPATPIYALRRIPVDEKPSFVRFLLALLTGRPHRPF